MSFIEKLRRIWAPTAFLDRGYIGECNISPSQDVKSGYTVEGSIAQYVSRRFTRGSILGQLRPLLTAEDIAARYKKSQVIRWNQK